jgi:hypothetical protein
VKQEPVDAVDSMNVDTPNKGTESVDDHHQQQHQMPAATAGVQHGKVKDEAKMEGGSSSHSHPVKNESME